MKAGIVGKPGKGQREEQGTEKAIGAVLRRNDDKVGTGFLPGQQQVHIVVACDFIYQGVLKDCKPVAKADDNIAPEVFPGLQEQTVRSLCRMLRRKLCQNTVDLIDAFVGKDPIDVTKAALLDGQQVALGILQITDIVDECHEQVQLGTAPEVVSLVGSRGVLDDGVGHGGHKVGIGVQIGQTVPPIRVSHIQKVDRLHVKASFPKIRRKHFKQLALRVGGNDRLQMGLGAVSAAKRHSTVASLGAAHEEWYDEAPGLVRARGADAQYVIVLTGLHAVGHIGGVFIRVIRVCLDAAQQHTGDFLSASKFQVLGKLLFGAETGCAMGTVWKDIKAAGISSELVAGEPAVPLFCDEADQQQDDRRHAKTEGRKDHEKIFERIENPYTLDHFTGGIEYRLLSKLQGIEKHPIEIPSKKPQHNVEWEARLVAFIPAPPFICHAVLQFFQQFG